MRFSDAVLVEVNETFTRTLGYSRDEIIGKTPFELNSWVAPERLHGYREQLETKGFVRDFEVELRSKDGSIRTVLVSANIIEINRDPHVLGFGLDIAEGKRAEAELQKALARERELSQLKSDFVSLVSRHEADERRRHLCAGDCSAWR